MERVKTKHDLKRSSGDVVFVESLNKVYCRLDDEWVEKRLFTSSEVAREIGVMVPRVLIWSRKMGVHVRDNKFNLRDIMMLREVANLRKKKVPFKKIRLIKHMLV